MSEVGARPCPFGFTIAGASCGRASRWSVIDGVAEGVGCGEPDADDDGVDVGVGVGDGVAAAGLAPGCDGAGVTSSLMMQL